MCYCTLLRTHAADSGTCRDVYWEATPARPPYTISSKQTRELFHTDRQGNQNLTRNTYSRVIQGHVLGDH